MSRRDAAILVLVNALWGASYVVARGALAEVPPYPLAFLRCALAWAWFALVPSPGGKVRKGNGRREACYLALIGLLGFGAAKVLLYEGLVRSTATEAALLVNLEGIFTALLAALWLGQRLQLPQVGGILVAFAGAAFLNPDAVGRGLSAAHVIGNLLIIGAMACEALASILGVPAQTYRSPAGLLRGAMGWGMLCLAPFAAWQWLQGGGSLAWLMPRNLACLLYLALANTVLAYTLWYRVLGRVVAGRVAAFLYLQPLVGVLLGLGVGEGLTARMAVGGLLILAGVTLASRRPAVGAVPPERAAPRNPGGTADR